MTVTRCFVPVKNKLNSKKIVCTFSRYKKKLNCSVEEETRFANECGKNCHWENSNATTVHFII